MQSKQIVVNVPLRGSLITTIVIEIDCATYTARQAERLCANLPANRVLQPLDALPLLATVLLEANVSQLRAAAPFSWSRVYTDNPVWRFPQAPWRNKTMYITTDPVPVYYNNAAPIV